MNVIFIISNKSQKKSIISNSDANTVFEQLDDPIRRVSGAGQFVSLEVLLRVSMVEYVAYTRSYYGISVLIHSPEDYPQASATTTIAQPGCEVILAIIPSIVVSEPAVRSLTLKQRNCFFDDEVKNVYRRRLNETLWTFSYSNSFLKEKVKDN